MSFIHYQCHGAICSFLNSGSTQARHSCLASQSEARFNIRRRRPPAYGTCICWEDQDRLASVAVCWSQSSLVMFSLSKPMWIQKQTCARATKDPQSIYQGASPTSDLCSSRALPLRSWSPISIFSPICTFFPQKPGLVPPLPLSHPRPLS